MTWDIPQVEIRYEDPLQKVDRTAVAAYGTNIFMMYQLHKLHKNIACLYARGARRFSDGPKFVQHADAHTHAHQKQYLNPCV